MCSIIALFISSVIECVVVFTGGRRNWVQVLCNGGVASLISWFYIVDCGCGENPVDLIYSYRCSWLSVAVLGK